MLTVALGQSLRRQAFPRRSRCAARMRSLPRPLDFRRQVEQFFGKRKRKVFSRLLTHVHRCIGSRNATRQTLPISAKLTYLSVYDSRDGVSEHGAPPSPSSSLTHVHRCIGSHNATRQTLPTSVKLTYLSVSDSRDCVSERAASPSPPSSLTHVHRCIGSRNTTRQSLFIGHVHYRDSIYCNT
jgi:hypothetical protein